MQFKTIINDTSSVNEFGIYWIALNSLEIKKKAWRQRKKGANVSVPNQLKKDNILWAF